MRVKGLTPGQPALNDATTQRIDAFSVSKRKTVPQDRFVLFDYELLPCKDSFLQTESLSHGWLQERSVQLSSSILTNHFVYQLFRSVANFSDSPAIETRIEREGEKKKYG